MESSLVSPLLRFPMHTGSWKLLNPSTLIWQVAMGHWPLAKGAGQ
jgi:hypothetical protein